MRSRLGVKLTAVIVSAAVMTIVVVSLWVNFALDYQFAAYLTQQEDQQNQQVLRAAEALFVEYGDWEAVGPELAHIAMLTGRTVVITDPMGRVVLDTNRHMGGRMARHPRAQQLEAPVDAHVTHDVIRVDGRVAAHGRVSSLIRRQGVLSAEDLVFRDTINRSMVLAGVAAAFAALLVALLLSRQLVRPLGVLIEAVRGMGRGELEQRVELRGRDEIAYLGHAFNEMAGNVSKLEALRRKLNADLAHEIRTPLTTIRGYLEGIEDGVIESGPESWSILSQEVQRLMRLVDDLQELSKAEAPLWRLEFVDVCAILDEVAELTGPLAAQKGIQMNVAGRPSFVVKGSKDTLQRAFYNIVFNAIQYTPSGGCVRIEIQQDPESSTGIVSVSDTGVGIDEADIPYVFERFFRADPSRSRAEGGTGIGLAIARDIITAHRGSVDVYSTIGEGTTFAVRLPIEMGGSRS